MLPKACFPRARRISQSRTAALLLMSISLGVASSACDLFSPRPPGTIGEEGVVYFQPENDAVASVPLMAGSVFSMAAVGNLEEDRSKVAAGFFVSTNSNVIEVIEGSTLGGEFRVTGAGTTTIEVHDESGGRLDAIELKGGVATSLELLDAKLVGASVDARLPPVFAIVDTDAIPLFFAAENACGEALLAIGGVDVTMGDMGILDFTSREDPADFTRDLTPLALGTTTLTFSVQGDATVEYEVDVITGDDVDAVTNVAAASESPTVEFWGRAFSAGVEVIGTDFGWRSPNGRVSVSRASGPNVIASVIFPAEGEAEDTRPAEIEASAYGLADVVDIFTLQTADLVGQRVPPKEAPVGSDAPLGCNGDSSTGTCGAFLIGGLSLRRLRRFNRRRRA